MAIKLNPITGLLDLSGLTSGSSIDHGGLSGLGDDDHTHYLLLAGRAGGQTAIGGTAAGQDLTLQSTSNAVRGSVIFGSAGTSVYDEVNDRLGIGTSTPASPIDVATGAIRCLGIIFPAAATIQTNVGDLTIDPAAGAKLIVASGNDFQVDTNTLYVDSTNNRVGIGTDSPENIFNVVESGAQGVMLFDTYFTGQAGSGFVMRHSRGTEAAPTALSANDQIGIFNARGYHSGGAFSLDIASIDFRADEALTATNQGTHIRFNTTSQGSTTLTERMRIDHDGEVGIGTTNPSAQLDVVGSTELNGDLTVDTNTLFVDSTNNRVGIGTVTPSVGFHVFEDKNGNLDGIRLENPNAGASSRSSWRMVNDQGSANSFNMSFYGSGTTTPGRLDFINNTITGSIRMRIAQGHGEVKIEPDLVTILNAADSAREVLQIDQNDNDFPFIDFVGNSAADSNAAVSTLTNSGATTHHIQIEINGTKAWIAASTNNPT